MTAQQMDPSMREGGLGVFERYLTLWVALCIVAGVAVGRLELKKRYVRSRAVHRRRGE